MNPVQKIVSLLFKTSHPEIFNNDSFTQKELLLRAKIRAYNLHTGRCLQLLNDAAEKSFLVWYSTLGAFIACPITDKALVFSELGVLTEGVVVDTKGFFDYNPDNLGMISAEAEENKQLLRMISSDIDLYFI